LAFRSRFKQQSRGARPGKSLQAMGMGYWAWGIASALQLNSGKARKPLAMVEAKGYLGCR